MPDGFCLCLQGAPGHNPSEAAKKRGHQRLDYLFRTLSVLGKRLGPVLFQFPKSFHADLPALKNFLSLIPRTISCAFEFRNPSWLDEAVLDLLREKGCSLCTPDSDENATTEIISTASWGYLRLRRVDYTEAELSQWMKRIISQEWQKAFVFFKHEEEAGKGPDMATHFRADHCRHQIPLQSNDTEVTKVHPIACKDRVTMFN